MAKLFVSHAVKDAELVEEFVDLLHLGVGMRPDDIFCSSLPGMGIPTGSDFVQYIQSKVINPELVLLVISDAFLQSAFCLNEVGATWALSIPVHPLLVPPLGYSALNGVLSGKQASKLDDKLKLNDLRDDLVVRLKLTPYSTSHWERARDKFLKRLQQMLPTPAPSAREQKSPTPAAGSWRVESSGNVLKLNDRYFDVQKVSRPGHDSFVIELSTSTAEDEAFFERLRPRNNRGDVAEFAYQNDGCFVQITSIESTSQSEKLLWVVKATRTEVDQNYAFGEMNVQGHSADDIAEMRAGRVLINVPPPPKKRRDGMGFDIVEATISGNGNARAKTDRCIVKQVLSSHRQNLERGARLARLESVFVLKATRVIESVLEFSIESKSQDSVKVTFRGQRPRRYTNVEPEMIAIEGEVTLD